MVGFTHLQTFHGKYILSVSLNYHFKILSTPFTITTNLNYFINFEIYELSSVIINYKKLQKSIYIRVIYKKG